MKAIFKERVSAYIHSSRVGPFYSWQSQYFSLDYMGARI